MTKLEKTILVLNLALFTGLIILLFRLEFILALMANTLFIALPGLLITFILIYGFVIAMKYLIKQREEAKKFSILEKIMLIPPVIMVLGMLILILLSL